MAYFVHGLSLRLIIIFCHYAVDSLSLHSPSFRIRCESKPDLLPLYEAARFRSDYQDAILAAEGAVLHANAFNFHSGQVRLTVHSL